MARRRFIKVRFKEMTNELENFLSVLFSKVIETQGGYIEVRCIRKPDEPACSFFYDSIAELMANLNEFIQLNQQGYNVYYGVLPRTRLEGTKDAVSTITCLWSDMDAKKFQGSKQAALEKLQKFLIKPSMILDSGNGYHGYWLLEEPIALSDEAARKNAESILLGVQRWLNSDHEIDDEYLKLAINYLNETKTFEFEDKRQILKNLETAIDECNRKLKWVSDQFTSIHNTKYALYTPEDFGKEKAVILAERGKLEDQLKATQSNADQWLELTEKTFTFCAYARHHFNMGDVKAKREILSSLGSNLILKDKKLFVSAYEPFLIIKSAKEAIQDNSSTLEPEKRGVQYSSNGLSQGQISRWLGLVEDFRTANWPEIIQYPELVYQKSQQFLASMAFAQA